tara:strand:- start:7659 stop:8372 length:714 start_codon:yes stop_codon:yes gene_type:complete
MKLGLDLSLTDEATALTWQPSDEADCVGWYKYNTGFTTVSDNVSEWADQSGNGNDATQTDAANRPALEEHSRVVFDGDETPGGDPDHLDIPQLTIAGDLTIGVSMNLNEAGGVLLGDNTTSNEFIRFTATQELRIRNTGNTAINIDLLAGNSFVDSGFMVLTRGTFFGLNNMWRLYWNGVLQNINQLADTCLFDAIGVRKPTNNPLNGNIYELSIFTSASDALIDNLNSRLGSIPRK